MYPPIDIDVRPPETPSPVAGNDNPGWIKTKFKFKGTYYK